MTDNVIQANIPREDPKTRLHKAFYAKLRRVLEELRSYYGDEIDHFTADCEKAREGEAGIGGSVKQLAWAQKALETFKGLETELDSDD
jgi:hypothetical protein